MKSGKFYIIKIVSCENEQSWAIDKIGRFIIGLYTEHHKSRYGMIFLTKFGWHWANESKVITSLAQWLLHVLWSIPNHRSLKELVLVLWHTYNNPNNTN